MNEAIGDNPDVGLVYDDDAHLEPSAVVGKPAGLFGRHVASSEFFDAWLSYGNFQHMVGVVSNQRSSDSLARRFSAHPRIRDTERRLDIVSLPQFQARFFPDPPARVLHLPQPVDTEFAWSRHHKLPHAFALSGITHTISLKGVMDRFRDLVTGPFEPYDTLFCISKSAIAVVRAVTDNYAAFLKERHGGDPRVRIRLAHVPLGIDTEKFRPASGEERAAARQAFGVAADEVCVLFVGRLSFHSKVHPFPMFRAAAEAARRLNRKVHVILAGWSENSAILKQFQEGSERLASGVRTTIIDGSRPENRFRVWHAADIFTSLTDNIQETLSQTVLEAQACGLPVLVTDWDGCRDEVAAGETGFLVSTRMTQGATADGSSRHMMGETSYDQFLGETNQTVAVDTREATNALERLIDDPALRERMGAAGRARILELFTWPDVIRLHQEVWREQECVRREHALSRLVSTVHTPVPFPDVEYSFASYPSALLDGEAELAAADDASGRLDLLLKLPLTNYLPQTRIVDRASLMAVITAAKQPSRIAELELVLAKSGRAPEHRRATLAWLLKYDLLQVVTEHR